jgi:hypothetical protein
MIISRRNTLITSCALALALAAFGNRDANAIDYVTDCKRRLQLQLHAVQ